MPNFVNIDVRLDGSNASAVLNEMSVPFEGTLDLGGGACASRMLLLSAGPGEILTLVASVATIGTSAASIGRWLYKLANRKGVVIERIGRTTIERLSEDEIVRIVHEEIERSIDGR